MPDEHAKLSPSSSSRWLTCTASVALVDSLPKQEYVESVYAAQGTAAHELGEIKATRVLVEGAEVTEEDLHEWSAKYGIEIDGDEHLEMHNHTEAYVDLLRERLSHIEGSVLFLEQRVYTGVPLCWGTADAVICGEDEIEIWDLKYGQGVHVSAEGNTQLMLYGVGALETFGDLFGDPKRVTVGVFQPRINNTSHWSITADNLREWRDEVIPLAEAALDGTGEYAPSDAACRWCPAAGVCRARMEKMTAEDFGVDADKLTPEEIAELLPKLKEIKSWCNQVEATALRQAYSEGVAIPGYKVTMKGGRRFIAQESELLDTLRSVGYNIDDIATFKPRSFGHLEKLVGGRKDFDSLVGKFVSTRPPSPSLVPDSDPGEAVDPNSEARKEFVDE